MTRDSSSRRYYYKHKDKILAKRRKRRAENPDLYKKIDLRRFRTETHWIKDIYTRAKIRARLYKVTFNLTFDQILKSWEKHKKKYGKRCAYTKKPLTFIRGTGKVTWSNISLDRLSPSKGYVLKNIVFCTSEFNRKKNDLSIKDCKAILSVYKDTQ